MKPKHIETRVESIRFSNPRDEFWHFTISYRAGCRLRQVVSGLCEYTRRDSARRGAQRAWRRIVKGRA